jgi:type IV secretory pathway TrbF-like protein
MGCGSCCYGQMTASETVFSTGTLRHVAVRWITLSVVLLNTPTTADSLLCDPICLWLIE